MRQRKVAKADVPEGDAASPADTQGELLDKKKHSDLPWKWLIYLILFRWLNAVCVRTQFDPDEYWQALEPAHLIVFGEGFLTWEWSPAVGIRSWLYPVILSIPLSSTSDFTLLFQ